MHECFLHARVWWAQTPPRTAQCCISNRHSARSLVCLKLSGVQRGGGCVCLMDRGSGEIGWMDGWMHAGKKKHVHGTRQPPGLRC